MPQTRPMSPTRPLSADDKDDDSPPPRSSPPPPWRRTKGRCRTTSTWPWYRWNPRRLRAPPPPGRDLRPRRSVRAPRDRLRGASSKYLPRHLGDGRVRRGGTEVGAKVLRRSKARGEDRAMHMYQVRARQQLPAAQRPNGPAAQQPIQPSSRQCSLIPQM